MSPHLAADRNKGTHMRNSSQPWLASQVNKFDILTENSLKTRYEPMNLPLKNAGEWINLITFQFHYCSNVVQLYLPTDVCKTVSTEPNFLCCPVRLALKTTTGCSIAVYSRSWLQLVGRYPLSPMTVMKWWRLGCRVKLEMWRELWFDISALRLQMQTVLWLYSTQFITLSRFKKISISTYLVNIF